MKAILQTVGNKHSLCATTIESRFCLQFSYQKEDAVLTGGLFYSVLPVVEGMHIGYIGP